MVTVRVSAPRLGRKHYQGWRDSLKRIEGGRLRRPRCPSPP